MARSKLKARWLLAAALLLGSKIMVSPTRPALVAYTNIESMVNKMQPKHD
jgi:hypothetical protein